MRNHWNHVGDVAMTKFRVVKVHSFRYKDKRYAQGEIVELSDEDAKRFAALDFLEPIKEKPKKPEKLGKLEVKTEQIIEEKPEKPRKKA